MTSDVQGHDSFIFKLKRQPFVRKLWSSRQLYLRVADTALTIPATTLEVGINDFQHLSRFEQTTSWLTREDFLSRSRKHCEQRDCYIFSVVDAKGPLLGYGMAQANAVESRFSEVEQRVRWPRGTGTMFSGFVHPSARGRGIHSMLHVTRISFLIRDCKMHWAVGAVEADNVSAMHSSQKTPNFRLAAILETRFRVGFPLRAVTAIDPTFDAQFLDAPLREASGSHP
jgi:ribosomal protein S18 acetylase RimI-like enzyme